MHDLGSGNEEPSQETGTQLARTACAETAVHDLGSGNEGPSQETGACVDAVKNPLRHAANAANT